MKKVTAFVGSARKQHTYNAVCKFLSSLQSFGDVEYEIVRLSECNLVTCRGCKLCLDKGEEFCQFKDDRDLLLGKMMASDGVVFASPNYSFQVSAIMKKFLDRLGFVFHRPRFFGKAFTSIVVQGIYGGPKIVEYLDFVGDNLGFNVVKGSCITSLEPIPDEVQRKNNRILEEQSIRFYDRLSQPSYPVPTLFKLMIFRMSRTAIARMLNESYCDYTYYRDKGWFESNYFYPVRLNPLKKIAGNLFDYTTARSIKK
ncbi:MAG: flavodoxin family protein [bacterium]|nr:flavodoxin family protein [bacterium]